MDIKILFSLLLLESLFINICFGIYFLSHFQHIFEILFSLIFTVFLCSIIGYTDYGKFLCFLIIICFLTCISVYSVITYIWSTFDIYTLFLFIYRTVLFISNFLVPSWTFFEYIWLFNSYMYELLIFIIFTFFDCMWVLNNYIYEILAFSISVFYLNIILNQIINLCINYIVLLFLVFCFKNILNNFKTILDFFFKKKYFNKNVIKMYKIFYNRFIKMYIIFLIFTGFIFWQILKIFFCIFYVEFDIIEIFFYINISSILDFCLFFYNIYLYIMFDFYKLLLTLSVEQLFTIYYTICSINTFFYHGSLFFAYIWYPFEYLIFNVYTLKAFLEVVKPVYGLMWSTSIYNCLVYAQVQDFTYCWLFIITFDTLLKLFCFNIHYIYITLLICYTLTNILLYFNNNIVGLRGAYTINQWLYGIILLSTFILLYINTITHTAFTIELGTLILSDGIYFILTLQFDFLSIFCTCIVSTLITIILTFGLEYMSRESLAYDVIITLALFASSINWFIFSYDLGLMVIFWEFSGIFSLLLIDMYYGRIRTAQATSRTYSISRFSDYFFFLAAVEMFGLCKCDLLPILFKILPTCIFEPSILGCYIFEITTGTVIVFSLFAAAACKCAQFILYVWLPDAMEAPTPASALIHSSTLVVMGIFMLLRCMPILNLNITILYFMSFIGAISIAYGAIFSIQTNDLKKAVAYSTISQIGYLFCGCGFMAYKETLLYLAVHAICKAMLFVFVGYIVHSFGGTTSLRKMGGLFYIMPDLSIYVFILCIILAGAPYTVGFFAKELIIAHLLSVSIPFSSLILFCWFIAFFCTPIYLYRICIIPLFGKPKATRFIFRNLVDGVNKTQSNQLYKFDLNFLKNKILLFFTGYTKNILITSRTTSLLHFGIIIFILFFGQKIVEYTFGIYNIDTLLFGNAIQDLSTTAIYGFNFTPIFLTRNVILLTITLYITCSIFFMFINNQNVFNFIGHFVLIFFYILILIYILLGIGCLI